jgi:membrane-associated protein
MGDWFYALMFGVIFAETGLVITPFLPGDSLLFALGLVARNPQSEYDVWTMGIVLTIAALLGDNTNYWVGRRIGPRVFASETSRLLNKKHLLRAQEFYEKHGALTIVLARFIAIIRTFAPFVAGIGRMSYPKFLAYSVFGGIVWVWSFLLVGYTLGEVPAVKQNMTLIVWIIMGFTIVLGIVHAVKNRRAKEPPPPPAPPV